MYKFKLLFAILLIASIFSCSKDDSIKKDIPVENKASSNLANFFDNNDIKIVDGIMLFKDNLVFEKAIEELYALDQDTYVNLSKEKGFLSFSQYFESVEDKNLMYRENPHLVEKKGDEFVTKLQLDRISSKDGIYIIGENVIFNNNDYQIVKYKYSSKELTTFIADIKLFEKSKSTNAGYHYHVWQKENNQRNCQLSSFVEVLDYDNNNKYLKAELSTWFGLNPVRNSSGTILSWNYNSGYRIRLTSMKRSWTGWYWTSHRRDLRYKVDGLLNNIITPGNPNVNDNFSCNNCAELTGSRVNLSLSLAPGLPVGAPPTPTFNWITQRAQAINESAPTSSCNGVTTNSQTICHSCF